MLYSFFPFKALFPPEGKGQDQDDDYDDDDDDDDIPYEPDLSTQI